MVGCFLHFSDEKAISVVISDLPMDQLDVSLPSSRITSVFLPSLSSPQNESVLQSLCRVALQLRHSPSFQSAGRWLLRTFVTLSRRFCTTRDAYRSLFITYSVSLPESRVFSNKQSMQDPRIALEAGSKTGNTAVLARESAQAAC